MDTHFLPFSGHTCALQGSRLTVTYDNASFPYLLDAQLQCMKYFRTSLNQHTGTSQYLLCLVSPSLIYPRNSREGIIFNDIVIFPECIDFSYFTIVIVTLLEKKTLKVSDFHHHLSFFHSSSSISDSPYLKRQHRKYFWKSCWSHICCWWHLFPIDWYRGDHLTVHWHWQVLFYIVPQQLWQIYPWWATQLSHLVPLL